MNSEPLDIIKTYLKYFENETKNLNCLINFIEQSKKQDENIYSSTNTVGHITASGFIYVKDIKSLLLLEHKKLGRFLQPGGHVENTDNTTLDTAKREVYEETGLENLELVKLCSDKEIPFDINTHLIPENPAKNMPEHYHHDFRYLFTMDKISDIKIDLNESNNYKWIKISDLQEIDDFKIVTEKINKMLL